MKKSIMQDEKVCFITGSQTQLDRHHCFHGTANRKLADKYGCWIWLRHDLHMELHQQNPELDMMIKRACQERFEELYGRKKFMEVFGKSYLMHDEDKAEFFKFMDSLIEGKRKE